MRYYLAYGSNLNKEQMAHRCPDAVPVGTGRIDNYELVFRRGYLTIEPKDGASVPVGIWEISPEDEKALDRYEGFPRFYRKETFAIDVSGIMHECLVYIMNPGFPIEQPSGFYLRTVDKGYSDFGFSLDDWKDLFLAHMRSVYTTDHTTKVGHK